MNFENFIDNSNIGTSNTFTIFFIKLVNTTQQDLDFPRPATIWYVSSSDHYQNDVIKGHDRRSRLQVQRRMSFATWGGGK